MSNYVSPGSDPNDPNALIILPSSTKKKRKQQPPAKVSATARRNAKRKLQREAQGKLKLQRKVERQKLFDLLAESNIKKEQVPLFLSSSNLGQSESYRQRLKRAVHQQRAGLPLCVSLDREVPYSTLDSNKQNTSCISVAPEESQCTKLEKCSEEQAIPFLKPEPIIDVGQQPDLNHDVKMEKYSEEQAIPFLKLEPMIDVGQQPDEESSIGVVGVDNGVMLVSCKDYHPQPKIFLKDGNQSSAQDEFRCVDSVGTCCESTTIDANEELPLSNSAQTGLFLKKRKRTCVFTWRAWRRRLRLCSKCKKKIKWDNIGLASRSPLFVPVNRSRKIQDSRSKLPIFMEEQSIVEAVRDNSIVIIVGETGCGKTTQVPQFLFEAGFGCRRAPETSGMIGVTQPRRVAAVSMAARVATELGTTVGEKVAYQIRYDTRVDPVSTVVKFMTDGILLREIQGDFLLRQYSVLILDEAHERNINTDILLGLLSRIVPLRNRLALEGRSLHVDEDPVLPIKLIIMSATLCLEDFVDNTRLFNIPPPLLEIEARQYPVTVHFSRRTIWEDWVDETYRKVCKIHTRLPRGGILVFLTGRQEIEYLCGRLRQHFSSPCVTHVGQRSELDVALAEKESRAKQARNQNEQAGFEYLHVLPLYGALPPERQHLCFAPVPQHHRLVVVATNVAETAITIPDIVYVVDSGRVKERYYDSATGISGYSIDWISKAAAAQRAGRAGRTGPGHCYRLFSSAVFSDFFPSHLEPEILRTPIENVVLQMKALGIEHVAAFPFVTPPNPSSIRAALKNLSNRLVLEKELSKNIALFLHLSIHSDSISPFVLANAVALRALNSREQLSPLGSAMAKLPVNPRLAKMIILSQGSDLLSWVADIVAGISVQHEIFLFPDEKKEPASDEKAAKSDENNPSPEREMEVRLRKKLEDEPNDDESYQISKHQQHQFSNHDCDFFGVLEAIIACRNALESGIQLKAICHKLGLRVQSMIEAFHVRDQIARIFKTKSVETALPSATQQLRLRKIMAASYVDQVARRLSPEEARDIVGPPFPFSVFSYEEPVWIHPSSGLLSSPPDWVIYHELHESHQRVYMRGVTGIKPDWLFSLAPHMIRPGAVLPVPSPKYDPSTGTVVCLRRSCYGPHSWALPVKQEPLPDQSYRTRLFAQALLEGSVFPYFKQFVPCLTIRVSSLSHTCPSRAIPLITALEKSSVSSRDELLSCWRGNSQFLLREFCNLVEAEHQNLVNPQEWPPCGNTSLHSELCHDRSVGVFE